MNSAVILAIVAGAAIALQVTAHTLGLRLGTGAFITVAGAATGVTGLMMAMFLSKPELTLRAVSCALASGALGAFVLGATAVAAGRGGIAQTLSLVIASQLVLGLVIDRFGPGIQEVGPPKILGVVLVGGILVVRY